MAVKENAKVVRAVVRMDAKLHVEEGVDKGAKDVVNKCARATVLPVVK